MGGENEFKTPAKKSGSKTDREETIGELRIHESKGEVHFHDDDRKLKVAMPVATWYAAWQRLTNEPNSEFNYADVENGTALLAKVACIVPDGGGKTQLDLHLYIEETEITNPLKAMISFMDE